MARSLLESLRQVRGDLKVVSMHRVALVPVASILVAELVRWTMYNASLGCRAPAGVLGGLCHKASFGAIHPIDRSLFEAVGLAARVHWHGVATVTVLVGIAAFFAGAALVWESCPARLREQPASRKRLLILVALTSILASVFAFHAAQGFVLVSDLLADDRRFMLPAHARYLRNVAGLVRASSFLGAVPLFAAAGFALCRTDKGAPEDLARRMSQLRAALFIGAGLLVTGVVEFQTFVEWLTPTVSPLGASDQEHRFVAAASRAAAAMVRSQGVVYVSYLALMFAPAAIIQSIEARALASEQATENTAAARLKWLQDHDLAFSFPRQLASLVAVISPVLVGNPLARLLDFVK